MPADNSNSNDVQNSPNGERKTYPRWVQLDPNVGAVLVRNQKEEDDLTGKLQANIDQGQAQRDKEAAAAKQAQDDATLAEANRIKAERKGS